MNVPRLAARNRVWWREGKALIERIAEDGRVTARELDELRDWQGGGLALGTCVEVNDARGRATSAVQVRALNREYDAWLEKLPETA